MYIYIYSSVYRHANTYTYVHTYIHTGIHHGARTWAGPKEHTKIERDVRAAFQGNNE